MEENAVRVPTEVNNVDLNAPTAEFDEQPASSRKLI
jgi:hypothetical protein